MVYVTFSENPAKKEMDSRGKVAKAGWSDGSSDCRSIKTIEYFGPKYTLKVFMATVLISPFNNQWSS